MARLNAITNLAIDDALPEAWVDQAMTSINYLTIAGANLASAATINPTAEFHQVTGAVTIDNIVDATGAVAGQQVRLLFQSALTVRNNGGGTGNIRTKNGQNRTMYPNEIATFVYDGAVWREAGSVAGETLDYVTGSGSSGQTTSATPGTTLITGATRVYDTRPVLVQAYVGGFYAVSEGQVLMRFFRGAADVSGTINSHHNVDGLGTGQTSQKFEWVDATPPGGSYAYSLHGWEPSAKGWGAYTYIVLRVTAL